MEGKLRARVLGVGLVLLAAAPGRTGHTQETGRGGLRQAANELAVAADDLRAEAENLDGSRYRSGYPAIVAIQRLEESTAALREATTDRAGFDAIDRGLDDVAAARATVRERIGLIDRDLRVRESFAAFEQAYAAYRTAWRERRERRARSGYGDADYDRDGYDRTGYNRDGYNRDGYRNGGYGRGDHEVGGVRPPEPVRDLAVPAGTRVLVRTDREMCSDNLPLTGAGDLRLFLARDLVVNGRTLAPAGARVGVNSIERGRGSLTLVLTAVDLGPEFLHVDTTPVHYRVAGNGVWSDVDDALEPHEKGRTPFRKGNAACLGSAEHMEFTLARPATVPAAWLQ